MKQCAKEGCRNNVFSHKYCKAHQYLRTDDKYKKPKVNMRKPTGELELFKEIWYERKHICADCGSEIRFFSHSNFHHILAKSREPKLRLVKENILILCFGCHQKRHFGINEQDNG